MSPEIALRGTDTESLDSGHFGVLFNQKRVYVLVSRKVYCELNWHITQQGGFNRKWIVNSKADPAFCTTSRTCPQPMYFVYSVFRIQIQMSATQESRSDGILNTFVSDRAVGLGPMLTCMRRPSLQGEPLWFETETSETHGHFIFLMQVPEIVRAKDTVAIQLSSFHALISWMPRCWSPFPRRFFFIRGTKDQDLILPTSNKKPTVHMSTWCYHGRWAWHSSWLVPHYFTLGLSVMPSNHHFFFVCSLYFPHSSSPHLYLRHTAVWPVTCTTRTELESNYSGALVCLVTPLISSIRIDRCLSSMRPEGMPFLPETARPRFGLWLWI